jgi:hypothetical protein
MKTNDVIWVWGCVINSTVWMAAGVSLVHTVFAAVYLILAGLVILGSRARTAGEGEKS